MVDSAHIEAPVRIGKGESKKQAIGRLAGEPIGAGRRARRRLVPEQVRIQPFSLDKKPCKQRDRIENACCVSWTRRIVTR
jgi:hypothetical protein